MDCAYQWAKDKTEENGILRTFNSSNPTGDGLIFKIISVIKKNGIKEDEVLTMLLI